ncbi:sulfite exporter TauE/SafE family protein [Halogeometricum borinquense]|uniref:Sulfite exporter TauE/SafE family protein n=1 Tax=Halogeometricum borinquense TaxID=60847 RepID=A0A6C0UK74_9EURY|nr:sulfite exporter TauE/SafE family protein [Halogeometricum borinquense]QIB75570.1 sulfite exporter TauE/SafE family protein [Halogeometricum borinquense]
MTPLSSQASASLPTTGVEAGVFLVVGVLGGAHCLGMCGPLVSVYADRLRATDDTDAELTVRQVRQHTLFNLGRAAGYAVVGAILAAIGAVTVGALDAVVAIGTGVRATTGVLVGVLIMATGVSYLRGGAGSVVRLPGRLSNAFRRISSVLTNRVDALVGDTRIVGLGVGHAFLPCPITYPAYLYAFATADPVRAAFLLSLLGLGTIPTLFVYGTALGSLSAGRRRSLHRVLGAVFLVLGYLPLAHGLMLVGIHLPHPMIPVYQPLG